MQLIQVEVMVDNLDAGFVEPGQKVKLKFATYPFQKFGMAAGRVAHVSPDAAEPTGASASPRVESAYNSSH